MPSISVTNPELITSIDLGTASPKLAGVVDVSNFSTLQIVNGDNQDLTGFQGVENISALTTVDISDNKIVGDLTDFSNNTNCAHVNVSNNNYNGNMDAPLPEGIQTFYANNNNFEIDNSATIHDLSGHTQLAVYNTSRQSDSYGTSPNSNAGGDATLNWGGPGLLANTSVDAGSIEGAIPESIRVLTVGQTNISKYSKRILLTQLYDTFKDKQPTGWAASTPVNGVTYSQPRIGVFSWHGGVSKAVDPPNSASPGAHHYLLGDKYGFGQSSETTNAAAIAKLQDMGFSLTGF